ncbi:hypothetical protein T439DRAFT_321916 [Meredithblackwellia eburnea MCA 4105]
MAATFLPKSPPHIFHPLPNGEDNGKPLSDLFNSLGQNSTILLLPATTYVLHTPIKFNHQGNSLATLGYPTFESGQQAVIETRGEKESGAIDMFNLSFTSLRRVHIRGCRGWGAKKPESKEEEERLKREGKLGWVEGGGALVWMGGGDSKESVVEGCRLEDPRGWTAVHVCDFAQNPKVINNIVGPCGQQAPGGPWADGLSVAGRDSTIVGNTIIDATDGAIVVFCAPGSTIAGNTVIARERDLLGAINMVDDFPFDRDFTNTRVVGNTIKTEGAFIRLGIGCGMTCWSPFQPEHRKNRGGLVEANYIGPGTLGYGIALSSAVDFTVLSNVVVPNTTFGGDLSRCPWNAPPMPFLIEWREAGRTEGCIVQSDFIEGEASWLIGVEPGVGGEIAYEEGQLEWWAKDQDSGVNLKGGKWELSRTGELVHGNGKWRSVSGGSGVRDPVLRFGKDGTFAILDAGAGDNLVWSPTAYIGQHLNNLKNLPPLKPKPSTTVGHTRAVFASQAPYLTVKDGEGDTLYSTHYEYNAGQWELRAGQWVAIAPVSSRGAVGTQLFEYGAASSVPPPLPTSSRPGHHFSSFIRDLKDDISAIRMGNDGGGPPPVPPRNYTPTASYPPTFLFLNPQTAQLTLHSSASPAHPDPGQTHFVYPEQPSQVEDCWFVFQGDGNGVLYCKNPDGGIGVLFATNTNGAEGARKIALKGLGEEGGPAMEVLNDKGDKMFTSKR